MEIPSAIKASILAALIFLLSACSALSPAPTATATSTVTPFPTKTPIPTPSTKNYVVEIGVCLTFLNDLTHDPKNSGCTPVQRQTVTFTDKQNTVEFSLDNNAFYPYCAIYTTSGSLVSANIANAGATTIQCTLK